MKEYVNSNVIYELEIKQLTYSNMKTPIVGFQGRKIQLRSRYNILTLAFYNWYILKLFLKLKLSLEYLSLFSASLLQKIPF